MRWCVPRGKGIWTNCCAAERPGLSHKLGQFIVERSYFAGSSRVNTLIITDDPWSYLAWFEVVWKCDHKAALYFKRVLRRPLFDFTLVFSQWNVFTRIRSGQRGIKKEPAIEIAGLCLPLKPQKEKVRIFYYRTHDRLMTLFFDSKILLYKISFLLTWILLMPEYDPDKSINTKAVRSRVKIMVRGLQSYQPGI